MVRFSVSLFCTVVRFSRSLSWSGRLRSGLSWIPICGCFCVPGFSTVVRILGWSFEPEFSSTAVRLIECSFGSKSGFRAGNIRWSVRSGACLFGSFSCFCPIDSFVSIRSLSFRCVSSHLRHSAARHNSMQVASGTASVFSCSMIDLWLAATAQQELNYLFTNQIQMSRTNIVDGIKSFVTKG